MKLVVILTHFLASASAFQARPALFTNDAKLRVSAPPQAVALPAVAVKLNAAFLGMYGIGMWLRPDWMMDKIMATGEPIKYHDTAYMLGQYLGAAYLATSVRLLVVLTTATAITSAVLAPVFALQAALCLTSIMRLVRGTADKESGQKWAWLTAINPSLYGDALTLKIPLIVGQGSMATLCWCAMKSLI